MFLRKIGIVLMLLISVKVYAGPQMEKYILDGSLVLYFPKLSETTDTFKTIMSKIYGIEYSNKIERLDTLIQSKLSVNILRASEASKIGLDSNGAMAYVHLKKNQGYMIFTIKQERVLRAYFDSLSIPYRIEDKYLILSSDLSILNEYVFKGIGNRPQFQCITKAVNFNWSQKFIWISEQYLREKNPNSALFIPKGEWIGGTYEVSTQNMVFNLYTTYNNADISNTLERSLNVSQVQNLSFLDYESGSPAVVGQLNIKFDDYLSALQQIDILDVLQINEFLESLKQKSINLQTQLFPYMNGRISYVIRAFDVLNKQINLTITAQVNDKNAVKEALFNMSQKLGNKSSKSLFTQELYQWGFGYISVWIGVIEDHIIISTDETEISQLVQNIYEARNGFLRTQPLSFRRFIQNKHKGGQTVIKISDFLQNIDWNRQLIPYEVLSSMNTIKWDFYIEKHNNKTGRRDIITIDFISEAQK